MTEGFSLGLVIGGFLLVLIIGLVLSFALDVISSLIGDKKEE